MKMRSQGALAPLRSAKLRSASSHLSHELPMIARQVPFVVLTERRGFHSSSLLEKFSAANSKTRARRKRDKALEEKLEQDWKPRAPVPEIAFAFDIDGVLYTGGRRVEGAAEALRALWRKNYRYCFLTNGGGDHEGHKAASLTERLALSAEGNEYTATPRFIQSHTPMQGWSNQVKLFDTILITGQDPNRARKVAHKYGFKNVVTPADIIHERPLTYPFLWPLQGANLWNKHRRIGRAKRILDEQDPSKLTEEDFEGALKIDHIFVWNDPRDWSLDIQVIYDVLASHKGYVGTVSRLNGDTSLPNNGWQQDGQPGLWISNLDLEWKTQHHINRFGTGAFVEALKGVWRAATDGRALRYNALGKPLPITYDYAHKKLLEMKEDGSDPGPLDPVSPQPLKTVYMIGDNPESDIAGANAYRPEDGTEWKSILVRTGVWRPTDLEPDPRHKPSAIVDDVLDAVVWAMNDHGLETTREELLELGAPSGGHGPGGEGEKEDVEVAKEEDEQGEEEEQGKLHGENDQAVTIPSAPVGRIIA